MNRSSWEPNVLVSSIASDWVSKFAVGSTRRCYMRQAPHTLYHCHLNVLTRKIAKLVPLEGSITIEELATKTTLDSINLARVLRHAMSHQVFREPSPRVIAHTACSRLLATDSELQAWVGFNTEDIFPASPRVVEALERFPEANSLTRTGFNFAEGTVDVEPMFVTLGRDATRARRMGQAMSSLTASDGYELAYTVKATDFSAEDARGGLIIDLGGSHGFLCAELSRSYRNLRFVVQDLPKTIASAPSPIVPEDPQASSRIQFEVHDFFTEQPAHHCDADVFFFRWIMHNQPTPYAVRILKNLVPVLKPGARVIINDYCLRGAGDEHPWEERMMRGMDLVMMTLLNAQEREEREFAELFRMADSRFVFKVSLSSRRDFHRQ